MTGQVGEITGDTAVSAFDGTESVPLIQGGHNRRALLSSLFFKAGTWTPVITFVTPGDLAVAYSVQVGEYYQSVNWVELMFRITTSSFTFTTASGNLIITGSPATAKTLTNAGWAGSLSAYQGITKANYTLYGPRVLSASNQISINASGSAQTAATVAASDMPSGGSVLLQGNVRFPIA